MIIVSGSLYVDADARDAYVKDCVSVVEQARESPGCLDFVIAADPIEADRINVYERWDTDENLLRFRGSGPSSEQTTQIKDASVAKYRISATEDP